MPISNLLLKTFKLNIKIDSKNNENDDNKNLIEILKTKKYNEMKKINGKFKIDNLSDFYNKFEIEDKYKILDEKNYSSNNKSKKIEINETQNYYINEKGEKEYIFEIKIDGIKEYYFSKINN